MASKLITLASVAVLAASGASAVALRSGKGKKAALKSKGTKKNFTNTLMKQEQDAKRAEKKAAAALVEKEAAAQAAVAEKKAALKREEAEKKLARAEAAQQRIAAQAAERRAAAAKRTTPPSRKKQQGADRKAAALAAKRAEIEKKVKAAQAAQQAEEAKKPTWVQRVIMGKKAVLEEPVVQGPKTADETVKQETEEARNLGAKIWDLKTAAAEKLGLTKKENQLAEDGVEAFGDFTAAAKVLTAFMKKKRARAAGLMKKKKTAAAKVLTAFMKKKLGLTTEEKELVEEAFGDFVKLVTELEKAGEEERADSPTTVDAVSEIDPAEKQLLLTNGPVESKCCCPCLW